MKKLIVSIVFLFPFMLIAQSVDIYSRWYARLDDDIFLILDLSNSFYIGSSRINVYDDRHHRVDSFGYKRKFNTIFVDLDSTTILWTWSMTPLNPYVGSENRIGTIEILAKNSRGVPQKIKFGGDLPELSIYLDDHETIAFTRMVSKYDDEIEYRYLTNYGGEINYTKYLGEYGGFSMAINDVGVDFRRLKINKSLKKNISTRIIENENIWRRAKGTGTLNHNLLLDSISISQLDEWMKEAKKQHRLNILPDFPNVLSDPFYDSESPPGKLTFYHYPFRCGMNAIAVRINLDFSNSHSFRRYVKTHHAELLKSIFSEKALYSGEKQNILNEGYISTGNGLMAVEAVKSDFYFNEKGEKKEIKNKKEKYYNLIFSQSFSTLDNP